MDEVELLGFNVSLEALTPAGEYNSFDGGSHRQEAHSAEC